MNTVEGGDFSAFGKPKRTRVTVEIDGKRFSREIASMGDISLPALAHEVAKAFYSICQQEYAKRLPMSLGEIFSFSQEKTSEPRFRNGKIDG